MPIDYKISKVVVQRFRGIKQLEIRFIHGVPSVLIGSNNAGKSSVLNAIALALGGGGFHQWTPSESDFYCDDKGQRALDFIVQVHFRSSSETGYPAVKGVGPPTLVHGVQVKGRMTRDGKTSHTRTLLDEHGKSVTYSTRTPPNKTEKDIFAEHEVGYRPVNARLDEISEHAPEVWLFKPQNIEASLYVWKTGPISKLSKLLARRFLEDKWTLESADGRDRQMPATLRKAHAFFQEAVEAFPFWKQDMKPRLERVFGRYVGTQAAIDLKPDTQLLEEWLAQQLAISLASDPNCSTTPLRNMGDGWQSVIRLAALEALSEYPELVKERVVLLLEEPETHLHPHLCRKIRRVLADLAAKGWTVVYTTHSSDLVSFEMRQNISRLVREKGLVTLRSVDTGNVGHGAKLQSKLDERGAHDFLFGTAAVFCEGKDDAFATKSAFEKAGIDFDARSVSVTQCGSVSAIPAFAEISKALGIRWCALSDEDRLPNGSIKQATAKARQQIETHRTAPDIQVQWPCDLESALGVSNGKATPEVTAVRLADPDWRKNYPDFTSTIRKIASWVDPTLCV